MNAIDTSKPIRLAIAGMAALVAVVTGCSTDDAAPDSAANSSQTAQSEKAPTEAQDASAATDEEDSKDSTGFIRGAAAGIEAAYDSAPTDLASYINDSDVTLRGRLVRVQEAPGATRDQDANNPDKQPAFMLAEIEVDAVITGSTDGAAFLRVALPQPVMTVPELQAQIPDGGIEVVLIADEIGSAVTEAGVRDYVVRYDDGLILRGTQGEALLIGATILSEGALTPELRVESDFEAVVELVSMAGNGDG